MRRPRFPPGLGVAVAVLSVSFAAPLFRLAESPPLVASFWRLALAVVLLAPFTRRAWPAWRAYSARDWGVLVASGVALAAHFGLWVTSLGMTTVAAATSLVTLQAIFVAVGAGILGERLTGRNWVGVVVAVGGAVVIAAADSSLAPDSQTAVAGDLIALAAGLGSAIYMLIGRRLRATRGLLEYAVPVYAVAALALAPATVLLGQPITGVDFGSRTFLVFVLLAAVPMLGGHTVANWTLKYIPAHTVATWILLEPVGAALLAWPLLGEIPSWPVAAGGALVLAGAALTIPRAPAGAATEPPG